MSEVPITNPPDQNPEDQGFSGNIFGWRFSLFGLALILLFVAIAAYRHWALGVSFRGEPEKRELMRDSSMREDTMK